MEFQAQIFGIGFGIEIRFFIENLFKDSESGPKGKIVGLGFGWDYLRDLVLTRNYININ